MSTLWKIRTGKIAVLGLVIVAMLGAGLFAMQQSEAGEAERTQTPSTGEKVAAFLQRQRVYFTPRPGDGEELTTFCLRLYDDLKANRNVEAVRPIATAQDPDALDHGSLNNCDAGEVRPPSGEGGYRYLRAFGYRNLKLYRVDAGGEILNGLNEAYIIYGEQRLERQGLHSGIYALDPRTCDSRALVGFQAENAGKIKTMGAADLIRYEGEYLVYALQELFGGESSNSILRVYRLAIDYQRPGPICSFYYPDINVLRTHPPTDTYNSGGRSFAD